MLRFLPPLVLVLGAVMNGYICGIIRKVGLQSGERQKDSFHLSKNLPDTLLEMDPNLQDLMDYISKENKSYRPRRKRRTKAEIEEENKRRPENVQWLQKLKIGDKIQMRDELCEVVQELVFAKNGNGLKKIMGVKLKRPHLKIPFMLKADNGDEKGVEFTFSLNQGYVQLKFEDLQVFPATQ